MVADKKTIINRADIVFTAAESPTAFHASQTKLVTEQVNARLLDCSDAHSFSTSPDKDRIGNCFTWVNAAPTIEGLRHAIQEYDARVFVGDQPPLRARLSQHPTKFIRSVEVVKKSGSHAPDTWFDARLDLNPGFIVIYGGKGQGKSALADIIALAGASSRNEYFSFLNGNRFRDPRTNPSREYEVALTWCSSDVTRLGLDEGVLEGTSEQVQYIPQNFLEVICNEVPDADGGLFTRELNRVVFLHVPDEERLGEESLEGLIGARSRPLLEHVAQLRSRVGGLNKRISSHEEELRPENRRRLESNLADRQRELAALDGQRPSDPVPLAGQPEGMARKAEIVDELNRHRARIAELEAAIDETRAQVGRLHEQDAAVARVNQRISNLEEAIAQFRRDSATDLGLLGLNDAELLAVEINRDRLVVRGREVVEERTAALGRIDVQRPESFAFLLEAEKTAVEQLTHQLDEPERHYQAAVQALQRWTESRTALVGSAEQLNSLEGARASLGALERIPEQLTALRAERIEISRAIYRDLRQLADVFRTVYQPVERFVAESSDIRDAMGLNFEVSLAAPSFHDEFLEYLNLAVSGSFMGRDEGRRVSERLMEQTDLDSEQAVLAFVGSVDDHLRHDRRSAEGRSVFIADQLRARHEPAVLYDFVFGLSYLTPRFILQSQGRSLDQLSPGEKGTLLLAFYLLVDQRDVPLIIDQPEENLGQRNCVSAVG